MRILYADTDFFLALLKEKDWLKENAEKIYKKHKNEMWTSGLTLKELILIAYREHKDPTLIVEKASNLMEIREPKIGIEGYLSACYLMKKYNVTPFDALHAVYCANDTIVSSDKKYDEMGLKRIKIEEKGMKE